MVQQLYGSAVEYLETLCRRISNRSVGSPGNREATAFFRKTLSALGWETETESLDVIDWESGEASITLGEQTLHALASPYSTGCEEEGILLPVSSLRELEKADLKSRILLLYGGIAREQLMPKNFVFFNPPEHRRIISILEAGNPLAIICATGRNSALAGGACPFPLIEDGDFTIPSVYLTDREGEALVAHAGEPVRVRSSAVRMPATAYNVIGRKGASRNRIVITAHIDAKQGTPGAMDNATGVIVLLLLAEILRDYRNGYQLELVAFNGEDYYAVPGQMAFIRKNEGRFGDIKININIDGAGYAEGPTAYSFYGVPETLEEILTGTIGRRPESEIGQPWVQGDHSIFVQYGVPAVAVTSSWFSSHMETQAITHTPADNPQIINLHRVVEAAETIAEMIGAL